MTDILLLGSFHFMDSSTDFYSPEVQKELDSLARALLRFSPDAVAVEYAEWSFHNHRIYLRAR